ncbi:hypothetical protein VD0002_g5442 [Verticillium dahliae]|uniref:Uncharacterized protein n=1 Tax=Verticillium dahliae TaxID=27337 RepID=A0AA44WSJ9_VERDA|nr:hypothetical protein BJF96_g455 [Verticillium dahliae]PNH52060.1 hypothetical protein VD0003_g5232 [Verticillium dahliae]PNH62681.1 hypothetical protein VD0002_g5442 [Verticillium dahliae]
MYGQKPSTARVGFFFNAAVRLGTRLAAGISRQPAASGQLHQLAAGKDSRQQLAAPAELGSDPAPSPVSR